MVDRTRHWQRIYDTKPPEKRSWTQAKPLPSIDWITQMLPERTAAVIDVGCGTSTLIDALIQAQYVRPTALDLSSAALEEARGRLGRGASFVDWLDTDVLTFASPRKFDLWHDRAVFHFLTSRDERLRYLESLKRNLKDKGFLIIATFAPEGPRQCSGLDVMRFDASSLAAELGPDFSLLKSAHFDHITPWSVCQPFVFCLFRVTGCSCR